MSLSEEDYKIIQEIESELNTNRFTTIYTDERLDYRVNRDNKIYKYLYNDKDSKVNNVCNDILEIFKFIDSLDDILEFSCRKCLKMLVLDFPMEIAINKAGYSVNKFQIDMFIHSEEIYDRLKNRNRFSDIYNKEIER